MLMKPIQISLKRRRERRETLSVFHPRASPHVQHDNARPHDARIGTQFLEAENIPVLARPAYSPDMSPIEHVWDALDRRIRQRVPVPANIQQLHTAIEEEWTNIPQSTTWSTLCEGDVLLCKRQIVLTPDTDWLIIILVNLSVRLYFTCSFPMVWH